MSASDIMEKKRQKREKQSNIKNKLIQPFVNGFLRMNVSANVVSFMGLSCCILSCVFFSLGFWYMGWLRLFPPLLIFLGGLFDVIDGEVARQSDSTSPKGAFLDWTFDRFADGVIVIGLALGGLISMWLGYALLFTMFMISFVGAKAETIGVRMQTVGWMSRGERILYVVFALIAEHIISVYAGFSPMEVIMFAYLLLLGITLYQRYSYVLRVIGREDRE